MFLTGGLRLRSRVTLHLLKNAVLTMRNVSIRMRDGIEPTPLIRACHFRRIRMENVDVTNFNGDCLLLTKSDDEAIFRNVTCDTLEEEDFVRLTDEEFAIKSI